MLQRLSISEPLKIRPDVPAIGAAPKSDPKLVQAWKQRAIKVQVKLKELLHTELHKMSKVEFKQRFDPLGAEVDRLKAEILTLKVSGPDLVALLVYFKLRKAKTQREARQRLSAMLNTLAFDTQAQYLAAIATPW
jgi:uncharacterized small protein (DUF1192 family)